MSATDEAKPFTSINQQIIDAVAAAAQAVNGGSGPNAQAVASQMLALAAGLAMQDAVAQQRQAQLLHNAATTALVNALLDAPKERAEQLNQTLLAIRDLADPERLTQTLARLAELGGATVAPKSETSH